MAAVDWEALVVAMTLVPRFVSRNKSFALFEDPEVKSARARAAVLRGIVRQLAGGQGKVEALAVSARTGAREMRYRVPGVRLERKALLSETEYGCVMFLAARAGVPGVRATGDDRERIDAALRRLGSGFDVEGFAER
jgi:hypothetical protein